MEKQRDEELTEATEQLTDEKANQHTDEVTGAEKEAAGEQRVDEKASMTEEKQDEQAESGGEAVEAVEDEVNDDAVVEEEPEEVTGAEEIDPEAGEPEEQEIEPAIAEPVKDHTTGVEAASEVVANEIADPAIEQPYIGETEKNTHPELHDQVDEAQAIDGLPEIKQSSDKGLIEAGAALENDAMQPRDERLEGMNPDAVIGAADQITGADELGADGLDVFGDLGPGMGGDAADGAFDLPGFGGDSDAGDGFDPLGDFNLPGSSSVDLGSIGAGGDPRTGWDGQSFSNDGDVVGQGKDSGDSGQSGSDGGTDFGNPTGANRENPSDFGGSAGSSGASAGGGSWSGTTEWSDYTDSDGNQQIDGYEEYQQEDGTTLVIETHHDDEGGTTQKVTLYDKDGNVVESEETHEPPADNEGGNDGNQGAGNGEGGSESGSESGSEDAGSSEAPAGSGDDGDSRPNPYADQYYADVDISLTFSNEELTTPVEPGGDDISFGAERLATFGNGIYDPRTINPAPDGNGTDTGGDGADGIVGEGIVDPVGPTLFAGGRGFAGQLMSDDGFARDDEDHLDDFDSFIG